MLAMTINTARTVYRIGNVDGYRITLYKGADTKPIVVAKSRINYDKANGMLAQGHMVTVDKDMGLGYFIRCGDFC
jgi:uncharacterized protein YdbL (DUF1318 family)